MPQSLTHVIVHVVFSTKDRTPCIDATVRPALHACLAEVTRTTGCTCFRVGGVADHVHLAVGLARTATIAGVVQELKTSSSMWLKTQSNGLRDFAWQRGYGAFSVGPDDLDALIAYIDGQERHHRGRTFEEEYRAFLAKYGVEYDERYVWD
jgi:putative transposase